MLYAQLVTNSRQSTAAMAHTLTVHKAKAGMVHSVSGWTWGVQVKVWDPMRTRAIPEHLRGVFTTRRYTNSRLPLPLPYHKLPMNCKTTNEIQFWANYSTAHNKTTFLTFPNKFWSVVVFSFLVTLLECAETYIITSFFVCLQLKSDFCASVKCGLS